MRTLLPPTNGVMHAEMIQKQENLRNFVDKRTHGKPREFPHSLGPTRPLRFVPARERSVKNAALAKNYTPRRSGTCGHWCGAQHELGV
ncbi:MAG: hypothetical protein WBC93_05840 [Sulfitobacter sp.]